MIHVKQLVKYYGNRLAVDHLNLDVGAGQIVGILGPNGAGKTTTLRILTGFMPPTSGSATVNGFDVFNDSRNARRSIGYLPESCPLYPEMKVSEQLHYFGRLHGLSRADRNARIGKLTEACGLSQILDRTIANLSKGNKQRVGLAQALIHDPPVLILDEPTVGLDPVQTTEFRQFLVELARNKTVFMSTHILSEVEKTCRRIVLLYDGRVIADASQEELKARFKEGRVLSLEVQADADKVRGAIRAMEGISDVRVASVDGWQLVDITFSSPDAASAERVAAIAVQNRWPLRSVRMAEPTLEQVYLQAVRQAQKSSAA
jgi:ABC-2 type transport system ATP-binding protein